MEPIFIEVITSPNCPHSPKAVKVAKQLVSKCKFPVILQEESIVSEEGWLRAYELQIESTPAILINGRVAFIGVPTIEELREVVMKVKEDEIERTNYFF
jgi:glutaredoxin